VPVVVSFDTMYVAPCCPEHRAADDATGGSVVSGDPSNAFGLVSCRLVSSSIVLLGFGLDKV
jgi:hypothetical protein